MTQDTSNSPALGGTGVGLRGPHVPRILADQPPVPWFELLTDNHLAPGGVFRFQADAIAERYPVALHGVGMSLGGTDPLDMTYVDAVVALARRVGALHVSEHLAFTAHGGRHSHDLLPMPWTVEALDHLAGRIHQVQDRLGEPLLIENISAYLAYADADFTEAGFLRALCDRTGCNLLLDVNNVYVNAVNHGTDAQAFLDALPWDRVREIHIAGHQKRGELLIDTHGAPVCNEVVALFRQVAPRAPDALVLLEWDTQLPDWDTLWRHAQDIEGARTSAMNGAAA